MKNKQSPKTRRIGELTYIMQQTLANINPQEMFHQVPSTISLGHIWTIRSHKWYEDHKLEWPQIRNYLLSYHQDPTCIGAKILLVSMNPWVCTLTCRLQSSIPHAQGNGYLCMFHLHRCIFNSCRCACLLIFTKEPTLKMFYKTFSWISSIKGWIKHFLHRHHWVEWSFSIFQTIRHDRCACLNWYHKLKLWCQHLSNNIKSKKCFNYFQWHPNSRALNAFHLHQKFSILDIEWRPSTYKPR